MVRGVSTGDERMIRTANTAIRAPSLIISIREMLSVGVRSSDNPRVLWTIRESSLYVSCTSYLTGEELAVTNSSPYKCYVNTRSVRKVSDLVSKLYKVFLLEGEFMSAPVKFNWKSFDISKVVTSRLQTRNTENRQKIRKFGIASIVGRRWFSNTKTTRRTIGR